MLLLFLRMLEEIQNIFRDVLENDEIIVNNNTTADDIEEWDSLNHLNLVMALGEEFNISLEFEEVLSIEKIGDIYPLIEKRGIE